MNRPQSILLVAFMQVLGPGSLLNAAAIAAKLDCTAPSVGQLAVSAAGDLPEPGPMSSAGWVNKKPSVISTDTEKQDAVQESSRIRPNDPGLEPGMKDRMNAPARLESASGKLKGAFGRTEKRPTVALALGGGGTRGAAHIGVLKVLTEAGIPVDYIVGNSMGAVVGGLYSAGLPLDHIYQFLIDGSYRKAYLPGLVPTALISPISILLHPFKQNYAGLWSGVRFQRFLNQQLPHGPVNIESLPHPFSAVATNLIDGQAYTISSGDLTRAIWASSAASPFLQPVAIDDKLFIDGVIRANLPASAARESGADIVIAVVVDKQLSKIPAPEFKHLKAIASRMTDIMLDVSDKNQFPYADVVIRPDVDGISMLSNKSADVVAAENEGEQAALRALPEIRRRLRLPPGQPIDGSAMTVHWTEQTQH